VEEMAKMKIDWHSRPASDNQKNVVLKRFNVYLKNIGLHDETINLYVGRVRSFLDFANSHDPDVALADKYRALLIEKGLSRSHLNNTCFGIKKFYEMNKIELDFIKLRSNDAIPYYFDEQDVLAIFSVCSNIKHLAMLQTLFFGCLRSSELCRLDDKDLNLNTRSIHLRETKNVSDGIAYTNSECA
jgi:integrase/recombinase XerD